MGNLWFELTGEYYKSVKKLESTGDPETFYLRRLQSLFWFFNWHSSQGQYDGGALNVWFRA